VVDRRPGDLLTVLVGLKGEQVLGDGAVVGPWSVRTAADGGEQFVDGGAQLLRHLFEKVVGEAGEGVAERDFLEGGDAEGVLGADSGSGRYEDQERAGQDTVAFAAVAQLDQLRAADSHIMQWLVRGKVVARAEQTDRGIGAERTAQPAHQRGGEFGLDIGDAHAVPGTAFADELGQLRHQDAFEGLPQVFGSGLDQASRTARVAGHGVLTPVRAAAMVYLGVMVCVR
jgi:hypothetical protein